VAATTVVAGSDSGRVTTAPAPRAPVLDEAARRRATLALRFRAARLTTTTSTAPAPTTAPARAERGAPGSVPATPPPRTVEIGTAVTAESAPPPPAVDPCSGAIASVAWPRGWSVQCLGSRDGLLALSNPAGWTNVYTRPTRSYEDYRWTALHEAGHAWGFRRLTGSDVARWCGARGCDPSRFYSGGAQGTGWNEPLGAEDWAESWSHCHGGPYKRRYLGLGAPTPDLCALQDLLTS
jgi:hypothetical protein